MIRLHRLAARAARSQWSIDDIDWSAEPAVPAGLPVATYVDMVSQLYHSERATLEVLRRMIAGLPEPIAKECLGLQSLEEARHAETYLRYLERLGELAPMDAGLAAVFDAAFAYEGPAFGWVVALNLVMEHEALRQQRLRVDRLPCSLFRAVNQRIMSDETRHAAFGFLYLRHTMPSVAAADRAAVLAWVRSLWSLWAEANRTRYVHDGEAILRLDGGAFSERASALTETMRDVGLLDAADRFS